MTYTKNYKGSNSILLTPKSLSPWEVSFTTKRAQMYFFMNICTYYEIGEMHHWIERE
jgi:hypothetical protein